MVKKKICYIIMSLVLVWGSASGLLAQENAAVVSPVAIMVDSQFHFEAIPEGTKVSHVFRLQNKGTVPLEVKRVKTG